MLEKILHNITKNITPYGFFIGLGFVVAMLFLLIYTRNNKVERDNVIYTYVLTSIIGLVGSKIFYIFTIIKDFASDYNAYGIKYIIYKYVNGGFVFYGGLIFGYLAALYFIKSYKANKQICVPALIIAFLINFGFGRLGCLSVGCCHGIETTSALSIVYQNSMFAPNGVRLIPVQLYETIFDFLLFLLINHLLKFLFCLYLCFHYYYQFYLLNFHLLVYLIVQLFYFLVIHYLFPLNLQYIHFFCLFVKFNCFVEIFFTIFFVSFGFYFICFLM